MFKQLFIVFLHWIIFPPGNNIAVTQHQKWIRSLQTSQSQTVKIGISLSKDKDWTFLEKALQFTVQEISSLHQEINFQAHFNYIDTNNLLQASKTVCDSISNGVTIHILPDDTAAAIQFQLACDRLDLPCIDIFQRDSTFGSGATFSVQLNVNVVSLAVVDVMKHFHLNKAATILDGPAGVTKVDPIIAHARKRGISLDLYFKNESPTYRDVLYDLRSTDVRTFLVTIPQTSIPLFVQNVAELNMHDHQYTYIFTGMDLWLEDLGGISHIGINLMAFSPLNIANHENPLKMAEMLSFAGTYPSDVQSHSSYTATVPEQAAVLRDSLLLLAVALDSLRPLPQEFYSPVSCYAPSRWPYGSTIMNYLNTMGLDGLTGTITMKPSGRDQHDLQLLKLSSGGLYDIGTWNSNHGLTLANHTTPSTERPIKVSAGTEEDPLIVVSILHDPFLMLRDNNLSSLPIGMVTKEHVHGFVIDLLDAISRIMVTQGFPEFKYKIYLVPDGKFGIKDASGNWNGMIKELLSGNADLAVAPFTLTAERETVISFTKPFITTGIGILYRKPLGAKPDLFALMRSLSAGLWFASLIATAVIGLSMWLIARFSPLEWENRHFCTGIETDWAVNVFNLRNSFWFAMSSLMMQGCDINPRAVSTRLVGGVWWFYTSFLSAHFIAKLASVLTIEKNTAPFSSVDELMKHPEIRYGILDNGATYEFFNSSKVPIYQEMFERMMSSFPSVFVGSTAEGTGRVLDEHYAFLMETTEIEYLEQRNCSFTKIGAPLNTIQYGIGTPKDSPWVQKISMAILYLIENSTITALQEQWWKRGGICVKDEKAAGPLAINSTLVGGAFLILIVGLVGAVCMVIIEFIWNAVRNAHMDKASLWRELVLELRHALRFRASSTRPILEKLCRTCGIETHSLAAHQMHQHKDYTPMLFLDAATRHDHMSRS